MLKYRDSTDSSFALHNRSMGHLWCCTLTADSRQFTVDGTDMESYVSIRTICVGAEAKDEFNVVEMTAATKDGTDVSIPVAVLRISHTPSVYPSGLNVSCPIMLKLSSGSGPVHISGHNLALGESEGENEEDEEEDEDEEEEGEEVVVTKKPLKRPASGKKGEPKKQKLDAYDDDDYHEDDHSDGEKPKGSKDSKAKHQGEKPKGKVQRGAKAGGKRGT